MKTYIAFLRGINVSGQKKIKMADLRETLMKTELQNVRTYIQSGNIIFDTSISEVSQMEKLIRRAIDDGFGYDVPVIVKTEQEIQKILNNNPFRDETNLKGLYFALLHEVPDYESVMSFKKLKFENEDFHYTQGCVYLNCKLGAGKAKLSNNLIEIKLKVTATTRNLNTMRKMMALAQEEKWKNHLLFIAVSIIMIVKQQNKPKNINKMVGVSPVLTIIWFRNPKRSTNPVPTNSFLE